MEHGFPSSEHPNDADLLEVLLRREPDPHILRCPRCAQRADAIARNIDPLRTESAPGPFDAAFYCRQSAVIHARLGAREGSPRSLRSLFLAPLPRVAWAAAAVAAVLAVAVGLSGPMLVGPPASQRARPVAGLADHARRAQDRADDRLLRQIDDMLDEDPYDVELGDG